MFEVRRLWRAAAHRDPPNIDYETAYFPIVQSWGRGPVVRPARWKEAHDTAFGALHAWDRRLRDTDRGAMAAMGVLRQNIDVNQACSRSKDTYVCKTGPTLRFCDGFGHPGCRP